jgi:hypothetical protein
MSNYTVLDYTFDDYDTNRKGVITDHQIKLMHNNLLKQGRIGGMICLIASLVGCVVLVTGGKSGLTLIALPMAGALILLMGLRNRVRGLSKLEVKYIIGKVKISKSVDMPDWLTGTTHTVKIDGLDLIFRMTDEQVKMFNPSVDYRFHFTEDPKYFLSADEVEAVYVTS